MLEERVQLISGVSIDKHKIDDIAEKTLTQIMSELPEEARTYDLIFYILEQIKIRVKGSKIRLQ